MANLKQGTLTFPSNKRTNTIPSGKPHQEALISEKGKRKRAETPAGSKSDAVLASEVLEISSDEEGAVEIAVPTKRTRASANGRTSSGVTRQAVAQLAKQTPSPAIGRERLDVEDKAGRYQKYYNNVRAKMGHITPIHGDGQNRMHQMLRFFDMSYEYGPCIGMTRLERWERADRFGLSPPVEVRDILLTTEGIEKAEYTQCVLNGQV